MLKNFWRFFSIFFISLVVVAVAVVVAFFHFTSPADEAAMASQRFAIPRGQATSIIAQRLQEQGLIRQQWAFALIVKMNGLRQKIQAGSFELSPSMSAREIAYQLTVGTDDIWLTFPEGWRREEIAESVVKQGLVDFDPDEFLRLSKGMEGQLYPDTYLVSRSLTATALVQLLSNTFQSKVATPLATQIANHPWSLNQILTLASLVQRESANDGEMPLVAGILTHRLRIGMPLQVDATLQYVKGYSQSEQSWWPVPLAADKALASPYNTYQNPGLPPAPICSPSLAAIKAVLAPTATDALYYIHDNQGRIHTGRTLDEHNRNVNQYLR
jgi:UPF0755 protein